MDFTISRSAFASAVEKVEKIVLSRATVAILAHLRIELGKDGSLSVTATDLQRKATAVTSVDDQKGHGVTTVSASLLAAVLKRGNGDSVSVSISDKEMLVKIGKSRSKMPVLPATDFPDIVADGIAPIASFRVTGQEIARLTSACAFAMTKDETRYYLKGLFWGIEDDKLTCVGTDGSRLALIQMTAPEDAADMPGIILPDALIASLSVVHGEPSVRVEVSEGFIIFTTDAFSIASRLVDGSFPQFRRVIPGDRVDRASVDREALIGSIRRVETFAGGNEREMALVFAGDTLRIVAASSATGEASDEIEIDGGFDLTIGFNGEKLASALASMDGASVILDLGDATAPLVIRDGDDETRLVVVMPYRIGAATKAAVDGSAPVMAEAA